MLDEAPNPEQAYYSVWIANHTSVRVRISIRSLSAETDLLPRSCSLQVGGWSCSVGTKHSTLRKDNALSLGLDLTKHTRSRRKETSNGCKRWMTMRKVEQIAAVDMVSATRLILLTSRLISSGYSGFRNDHWSYSLDWGCASSKSYSSFHSE